MKVYVVGYGERGEGHDPHTTFTTFRAADAFVRKYWGIKVEERGWGFWMGTKNGVDEATISRQTVRRSSR